jgi:hypothetical protein
LDPVIKIGIHRLHNRVATTVVNINSRDTASFDVIQETAVTHPSYSSIAGSNSGAFAGGGATTAQVIQSSAANQLPNKQQRDAYGKNPEGYLTPALIHGLIVSLTTVRVSLPKPLF